MKPIWKAEKSSWLLCVDLGQTGKTNHDYDAMQEEPYKIKPGPVQYQRQNLCWSWMAIHSGCVVLSGLPSGRGEKI